MIILDTHIWIWWVHQPDLLTEIQRETIAAQESEIIGVSAISCWEIAKLVEYQRLTLPCSLEEWFEEALNYPRIELISLSRSDTYTFKQANNILWLLVFGEELHFNSRMNFMIYLFPMSYF